VFIPVSFSSETLFGLLAIMPFIIGYMNPPRYDSPPTPPDRRTPEEKAFDAMIKRINDEIERLTRLRDTHLMQRECEKELKAATGNMEALKRKMESVQKSIREQSEIGSSGA